MSTTPASVPASRSFLQHLRDMNIKRQAQVFPHCRDWGLVDSTNELCGEAGELANVSKKLKRDVVYPEGPFKDDEDMRTQSEPVAQREMKLRRDFEDEAADVLITLDLACMRANVDLEKVTVRKFNEVSEKRKSTFFLAEQETRWQPMTVIPQSSNQVLVRYPTPGGYHYSLASYFPSVNGGYWRSSFNQTPITGDTMKNAQWRVIE